MTENEVCRTVSSNPRPSRRTIIRTDGPERAFLHVRRAKRPGQEPPPARLGGSKIKFKQSSSHEQRDAECTSVSQAERNYVSRVTETASQFRDRLKQNKRQFCKSFPTMEKIRLSSISTAQETLQQAVERAIQIAKKSHPCAGMLSETRKRNVVCVNIGFRCRLSVPNYSCRSCKGTVTVHPFEVGCIPTSPTEFCETWIGLDYCLLFRDLQLHNGLSADGKSFPKGYLIEHK